MSFIACVYVLVGLMHFSVCVIFVYLSSLRCSRHFSILHARQSFFLPSFLNPNFISHTKNSHVLPCSFHCGLISSLPPCSSPVRVSCLSALSCVFHCLILPFCSKCGKCPTQTVFSKVHSHTVKLQLVGNAHPSIQSWWCHFSPCCRCLVQLLLQLFFTAQDTAVSSWYPSRCSGTAFLVFRERFLELVFSGWQTHGS